MLRASKRRVRSEPEPANHRPHRSSRILRGNRARSIGPEGLDPSRSPPYYTCAEPNSSGKRRAACTRMRPPGRIVKPAFAVVQFAVAKAAQADHERIHSSALGSDRTAWAVPKLACHFWHDLPFLAGLAALPLARRRLDHCSFSEMMSRIVSHSCCRRSGVALSRVDADCQGRQCVRAGGGWA